MWLLLQRIERNIVPGIVLWISGSDESGEWSGQASVQVS